MRPIDSEIKQLLLAEEIERLEQVERTEQALKSRLNDVAGQIVAISQDMKDLSEQQKSGQGWLSRLEAHSRELLAELNQAKASLESELRLLKSDLHQKTSSSKNLITTVQQKSDHLLDRMNRFEEDFEHSDKVAQKFAPALPMMIRQASTSQTRELSENLSPLIVSSIRTEIRNSREDMIEALYPITGQLVSRSVRNAFRELHEKLNEKLNEGLSFARWKAKVRSWMGQGVSEAEWLIAQASAAKIEELLLIDRHTGQLLAHIGERPEESDPDSLAGLLSVIMGFCDQATGSNAVGLQRLEAGNEIFDIQSSPTKILAIRLSGPASAELMRALENCAREFWIKLERESRGDTKTPDRLTASQLVEREFQSVRDLKETNKTESSAWPALAVAACLAFLLASYWIWSGLSEFWRTQQVAQITTIIDNQPELAAFPIDIGYQGEIITVKGLVPSQASRENIQAVLENRFPDQIFRYQLVQLNNLESDRASQALTLENLRARIATLEALLVQLGGDIP